MHQRFANPLVLSRHHMWMMHRSLRTDARMELCAHCRAPRLGSIDNGTCYEASGLPHPRPRRGTYWVPEEEPE